MGYSSSDEESLTDVDTKLSDFQITADPDMLIGDYDAVDEKPEVTNIHPDDSPEEAEAEPLADDCT